jgi:hypothetical protein
MLLETLTEDIELTINQYLRSIEKPDGTAWTSHDCNYVYWANDNDRDGAMSGIVDAEDLFWKNLIHLTTDGIELIGPDGSVQLPLEFNFENIKSRILDALIDTEDLEKILQVATVLGCEFD